jgi:hypothetical protein
MKIQAEELLEFFWLYSNITYYNIKKWRLPITETFEKGEQKRERQFLKFSLL